MKVLFIGIFIIPFFSFCDLLIDYEYRGICKKVIDGDTIIVSNYWRDFKVRLLYIDAPEIHQKKVGEFSKRVLQELIQGKEVVLKKRTRDIYGRRLSVAYLRDLNINMEMIRRGGAILYRYSDFESENERVHYQILETKARIKHIGIFNDDFIEPYLFRKEEKLNASLNNKILNQH